VSDKTNIQFPLVLPVAGASPEMIRGLILAVEDAIKALPESSDGCLRFSKLDHKFAGGICARTITVQAGVLLTTEIHKYDHHVFVERGRVSVFSEFGVDEVIGPCSFISPAGIKRLCYIHEETIWTTYHATKETDPKKIVEEATAKSYEEIGLDYVQVGKLTLEKTS